MVQLPVNLDMMYKKVKSAEAKKIIKNAIAVLDLLGRPHFVSEIGKERIRRAGKKILEEVAAKNAEIAKKNTQGELELESGGGSAGRLALPDVGFRVLKLDSSNMKDVYYNPKEFEEEFVFHDSDASLAENIKPTARAKICFSTPCCGSAFRSLQKSPPRRFTARRCSRSTTLFSWPRSTTT